MWVLAALLYGANRRTRPRPHHDPGGWALLTLVAVVWVVAAVVELIGKVL